MAKPPKVKFVESNERRTTLEARRMLEKLGVRVIRLPPTPVLERRFDLPFLETEDGQRYFGIEGIARFAQRYFKAK